VQQRNLWGLEMTRREFIQFILKTASAIVVGAYFITDKVSPRRLVLRSELLRRAAFIRAVRQKNYPGSVKPLSNINTQGKWRG
jgi:hypothetical protein